MEEYPKKEETGNKGKETNTPNLQDGKSQYQEFFSKVQRYFNSEIEFQQKNAKEDADFEVIE